MSRTPVVTILTTNSAAGGILAPVAIAVAASAELNPAPWTNARKAAQILIDQSLKT